MKWTSEAERVIQKVPFFVRKRVRARVEKEAADQGKATVTMSDVQAARNRFLNQMESEIRGFQVETCFGAGGCPNRMVDNEKLQHAIETLLQKEDILSFLKDRVGDGLKFHHEFRVALADCPNACSQPQIRDIGIIGAKAPMISKKKCTHCNQCVEVCQEKAITVNPVMDAPDIHKKDCVRCGLCISACPTGTIAADRTGYRILLGGKLGRHPRLAEELPGIFDETQVLEVIQHCVSFYKQKNRKGERFGEILEKYPSFIEEIKKKFN
jgi:dissimilatory sulfite reductase (desulfoviridin) alpha/beta subunit